MLKQIRFQATLIALCALCLADVCAAAPPQSHGALQGAPMLECSGMPCVPVSAGTGAPLKMLIDTGNAKSVLDKAVAQRLGLKLEPLVGPDGKVYPDYAKAVLAGVKIGGAALGDVPVIVMDLAADVRKGEMPDAQGTLAYTAFGARLLRMDYKRHRVELSGVLTHKDLGPMQSSVITLPTFGQHGPPVVVAGGFIVNGKPATVQIDTLYSGTLLIYPHAVERLGLTAQQQATAKRSFPFTDGGVQMIEGTPVSIQFLEGGGLATQAAVYFVTPGVHTPDGMFDGTVGQELFAGHVLSFDFYSQHFWIS